MADYCVLYNPKASHGKGKANAFALLDMFPKDTLRYADLTQIDDLAAFVDGLPADERLIVAGGDGTLSRFVNRMDRDRFDRDIYYYAAGTGNDFLHDLEMPTGTKPFIINRYLEELPRIRFGETTMRFINGVGQGIDSYVIHQGDLGREKNPDKKTDYTAIAIKGLLGGYKPVKMTVTVDGVEKVYNKVWMAPTMKGRLFGGGMMPTPDQDRTNPKKTVSVCVVHDLSAFRTLCIFPTIFKGEHVKVVDHVDILEGSEVTVKIEQPAPLQIDGETYLGVTEYTVTANVTANV